MLKYSIKDQVLKYSCLEVMKITVKDEVNKKHKKKEIIF